MLQVPEVFDNSLQPLPEREEIHMFLHYHRHHHHCHRHHRLESKSDFFLM
jgi:hypothetical protein